ncbi:MAG: hypothetical protein JWM90_563 [Thermoleophilia bacterium]|nr:hypothetical protein [Thermoleophilia bacterium]
MTTFSRASVSNLIPSWEPEHAEGPVSEPLGTSVVEQAVAAHVVEQAQVVEHARQPERSPAVHARRITPPPTYDVGDVTDPVPVRSSFAYDVLSKDPEPIVEPLMALTVDDVDVLSTQTLAREALRGRILAFAQQRERRSAYEIAFILLAGAVAVLLAAPPLVRVLLAARGIEA